MSTKISDIIVPEQFTKYVSEKVTKKSNILNSGIAIANPRLNELITGGGTTITMPYWKNLSGDDEVLSDSTPLTPGKIDAGKDIAAVLYRGKAFGANELAGALSGDDPVDAIAEKFADFRDEKEQEVLVSVLTGAFASSSMSNHVLDKSTEVISGNIVLDGKQLLGDSASQLKAIMMHSAVFTELEKQNLIQYTTTSDGKIGFPTYLGYNIIVDDDMPVDSSGDNKVYTTYLFANGAIGRGEGNPVSITATETDRDSLQGDDFIINRWAIVIHPMGVRWIGTPAGATPTNAELATGTNWERVYEDKNIGLVAIKHLI